MGNIFLQMCCHWVNFNILDFIAPIGSHACFEAFSRHQSNIFLVRLLNSLIELVDENVQDPLVKYQGSYFKHGCGG